MRGGRIDPQTGRRKPMEGTMDSKEISIEDATLADPAVLQNPFPFYATMREKDPVHYDKTLNAYLVARYEDVRTVLLDSASFSMERGWQTNYAHGFVEEFVEILKRDGGGFFPDVIMTDPPRHTRIRKLMEQAFTPRRVKFLEAGISARAAGFIDALPEAGEIDGINDFALPLTIDILAEQLGIPKADQTRIARWTLALSAQVGRMQSRVEMQQNAAEICALQRYVIAMIEARRKSPTNDLISDLVHARNPGEDDPVLDFAELVACTRALIGGGSETTANGIAGMLLTLATRPEAARQLRDGLEDERTVNRFVEEALRLSPPPRALSRVATHDVELGGVRIPENSQVLIMFASANRDERHFPDPDAFDLARPNLISHVTFGAGIHKCVGLALARMEMSVVAREVARRIRDIRLAIPIGELAYIPSTSNHSLQRLPLSYAKR
jgi:cytochrome P450